VTCSCLFREGAYAQYALCAYTSFKKISKFNGIRLRRTNIENIHTTGEIQLLSSSIISGGLGKDQEEWKKLRDRITEKHSAPPSSVSTYSLRIGIGKMLAKLCNIRVGKG